MEFFEDAGPSVVLAVPGMLQNGISRQVCHDRPPRPCRALIYHLQETFRKVVREQPQRCGGGCLLRRGDSCKVYFEEAREGSRYKNM
jgi:hypothetical protein